jgi:hypothetical protein
MPLSLRTGDKEDGGDGGCVDETVADNLKGGREVRGAVRFGRSHCFDGGADLGAITGQLQQLNGIAVREKR